MQVDVLEGSYPEVKSDVLILGCFEDDPLTPPIRYYDEVGRLGGLIAKAIQKKQFVGEFKQIKTFALNGKPDHLLLVGLGKRAVWSLERLRKVAGVSAKAARQLGATATTSLHQFGPGTPLESAKAATVGSLLGLYQFTKYKTRELDRIKTLEHMTLLDTERQKAELVRGMNEAIILADSVAAARDLVNTPAADLTPKNLANEAKRILKNVGCSVDIWDRKAIEKRGMHALLGVSRGSDQEPQFIVIEYGPRKQKPIVLAGKGVTFDSGGLNIKTPYQSMLDMKTDMAGAAAVIGAIRAAALLKVQHRIIGVIPATENMINGHAQKPGDVVKAANGKTIEILNTDAEGRLILADAISYAETLQPQAIIDLATLTGACMIALGYANAGLFTKHDELAQRILAAAASSGELAWRMPLTEEYNDTIKSDIADMRNISKDGYAGAIVGAVFLQQFVEKVPFAHIDIAGPSSLPDEREYQLKGGTGFGVRLLVELIQNWQTME